MKKTIGMVMGLFLLGTIAIIPGVSADSCSTLAGWGNPPKSGMASVRFFGECDIYGNFYGAVDGLGVGTVAFSILETIYRPEPYTPNQGVITANCVNGKKLIGGADGQEWCTYLCLYGLVNCDIYDEFEGWGTGIGEYTGTLKVGYDLDIVENTCTINGDGQVTLQELVNIYIPAWQDGQLSLSMVLKYIDIWQNS